MNPNRIGGQPLIAMDRGDRAGKRRADGTIGIADIEPECLALFRLHIRHRLLQQRLVQVAVIKRRVTAFGAVNGLAGHRRRRRQQRGEIQILLLRGKAIQHLQQIGTANQIHQPLHAQLRHEFTRFLRDKLEVVGHAVRQTVVVVFTQLLVLGCYAGRTVVEMANAEIFTAQRHHRTGAEAEAFCAENRRFNNIASGFQTAVDLQANLMTQTVGHQRLLGFHQAQLPRTAGILYRAERAGAGAAVVAGDGNQVGIGFGYAGCDGAYARL